MMFYDVLCLKSILGFFLSERTSGVSSVIFFLFWQIDLNYNIFCLLHLLLCDNILQNEQSEVFDKEKQTGPK